MAETSINVVSPSVTLFEKSTHVERAGSVLYVHKSAKMVATVIRLPLCTEAVPVSIGGQTSSIRHMNPLTEILYLTYTLAELNLLTLKCRQPQINRRQFAAL